MVRKERLTSMAMFPGIAAIVMIAGCPFPEKPFSSGISEPESEEEKACPVPASQTNQTPLDFFAFLDPKTGSNRCYAIFKGTLPWDVALSACQELKVDETALGATLISISGLDEHVAIRNWLSELDSSLVSMGQEPFEGPWTRGVRNNNVEEPKEDGAFYWNGPDDPNDVNGLDEPWRIFPCADADCACEGCGSNLEWFWGNRDGGADQPDSYNPGIGDTICVRYGISAPTWTDDPKDPEFDGRPGLADSDCGSSRAYICEWAQ